MRGAYVFLKNNGVTIGFAVGAFFALLAIIFMVSGPPPSSNTTTDELTKAFVRVLNSFDFGIVISFILIGLGLLAAIIGPAIYTAMNFKESIKFLVIFGALVILYFVSIAMGATPGAQELSYYQGVDNKHLTGGDIAFVDGLLIFTVIMTFLTAGSLIFMFVWGALKSR